jgi:hypothetical protein
MANQLVLMPLDFYRTAAANACTILLGYVFEDGEAPADNTTPTLEITYLVPNAGLMGSASATAVKRKPQKGSKSQSLRYYPAQQLPSKEEWKAQVFGGFQQQQCVGSIEAKVKWTPAAGGPKEITATLVLDPRLNTPVTASLSAVQPVQLSSLLFSPLETSPSPENQVAESVPFTTLLDDAQRAAVVADILDHVELALSAGIGYLWRRAGLGCSYDGTAYRDWDLDAGSPLSEDQLLECWAQHTSELLFGGPYLGTASNMGVPQKAVPGGGPQHRADAFLYDACVHQPNGRLLVPLLYECQQLATMTLICLGFDELAQNPLSAGQPDCGSLTGKTVYQTTQQLEPWLSGGWYRMDRPMAQGLLRPGTCFYYLGSNGFPHVAATLRASPVPPAQIQITDTGGWILQTNILKSQHGGDGCAYDSPWVEALTKPPIGTTTFSPTGVMAPPAVDANGLKMAIKRMRSAKMLGVARLVVRRRSDGEVWWVSQLLPMESVDGEPYSIARLVASLRGCPYANDMEVVWHVLMPTTSTSQQSFWNDPSNIHTPSDQDDDAANSAKACLAGQPNWWRRGHLFAVAAISVKTNGVPQFLWKAPANSSEPNNAGRAFPTRRRSDDVGLAPANAILSDIRTRMGWPRFVDMTPVVQGARDFPYFGQQIP